jgi:hypothetical protein
LAQRDTTRPAVQQQVTAPAAVSGCSTASNCPAVGNRAAANYIAESFAVSVYASVSWSFECKI